MLKLYHILLKRLFSGQTLAHRKWCRLFFFILVISIFFSNVDSRAQTPPPKLPTILEGWNGEYFAEKQGGFFLRISFVPKKSLASKGNDELVNIKIIVNNLLNSISYQFQYSPTIFEERIKNIWRAPSGKYFVRSIEIVNRSGQKLVQSFDQKGTQHFIVSKQCLSNLGQWTITQTGGATFSVKFAMTPNYYKENSKKDQSSVVAVINGFSGLIQEVFAGRKLVDSAKTGYSEKNEARITITTQRQIAMFYSLDLFKHNYLARKIADILDSYDLKIRQCYISRINESPLFRGSISFSFLLSSITGTMRKIKPEDGSINDPKMISCLVNELTQIHFPTKTNIIGKLVYNFDVK